MMHLVGIVRNSSRGKNIAEECIYKKYVIKKKSFDHSYARGEDRKDVVRQCEEEPVKRKTAERIQGYYERCGYFRRQRKMLVSIGIQPWL
jgi:hypothetical protein